MICQELRIRDKNQFLLFARLRALNKSGHLTNKIISDLPDDLWWIGLNWMTLCIAVAFTVLHFQLKFFSSVHAAN